MRTKEELYSEIKTYLLQALDSANTLEFLDKYHAGEIGELLGYEPDNMLLIASLRGHIAEAMRLIEGYKFPERKTYDSEVQRMENESKAFREKLRKEWEG